MAGLGLDAVFRRAELTPSRNRPIPMPGGNPLLPDLLPVIPPQPPVHRYPLTPGMPATVVPIRFQGNIDWPGGTLEGWITIHVRDATGRVREIPVRVTPTPPTGARFDTQIEIPKGNYDWAITPGASFPQPNGIPHHVPLNRNGGGAPMPVTPQDIPPSDGPNQGHTDDGPVRIRLQLY